MNNLTKTSLFVLLTIAAMAGIFFACEKNEPEAFVSNENSEFLQLSPNANLDDFTTLTENDRNVLREACIRLKINELAPNEKFKIKSGKEVNISEDIYNYFYYAHIANFKDSRKRRKVNGEGAIPDSIKCAQFVIHDILYDFGKNISVDDITKWCYSNGLFDPTNGTPSYKLPYILEHYFKSPKQCNISSLPQLYTRSGAASYIVTFKQDALTTDGRPTGHVARLDLYTGTYMLGCSSQLNGAIEVHIDNIESLYYVNEIQ